MRLAGLIAKEIRHRGGNFLLSTLGVIIAVAGVVALVSLHDASQRETRRLQRDIGFNLRIIPAATDLDAFYLRGFSQNTMPENVAKRLADRETIAYNHLVATLQREIQLDGQSILLTGISKTMFPEGQKRPPMSPTIEPGTAHVGHRVASRLGIAKGKPIQIQGQELRVVRVAPEAGTQDDIRVWVNLADAQAILQLPGQINEIQAIDCLCLSPSENPQELLRKEIEEIAPEATVAMLSKIATARARTRQMVEKFTAVAVPVLVVVGAAWVGFSALVNVRHRRQELGILRAIGYESGAIAGLVIGKAVVIGIVGAAVGFGLGAGLAQFAGPQIFEMTGKKISPDYGLLGWAVLLGPALAAAASFVPAVLAVTQDPALTLREE